MRESGLEAFKIAKGEDNVQEVAVPVRVQPTDIEEETLRSSGGRFSGSLLFSHGS
jgi:hypothetical protein